MVNVRKNIHFVISDIHHATHCRQQWRMAFNSLPRILADHPTGQLTLLERWRTVTAALLMRTARSRRSNASAAAPAWMTGKLVASMLPPEGSLAQKAWQLAQAHQPEWLNQHTLRTWAFAQALGIVGDLAFDREQLFAAAALHDIGLVPEAATPTDHCFAVRGARYATRTLQAVASKRAVDIVAHAIARHLDLSVEPSDGVEAHLLQAGAMADVLGRGLSRLSTDYRQIVLERHPRAGMKHALCQCMRHEAATAPRSRMGLYVRRIGFVDLIQRAPYED